MLRLQPRVAYYVVVVCEQHLNSLCNICVDVNLFRRYSRYVFMFIVIIMVSLFLAPVCCFECVYDVLKKVANVVHQTWVVKVIVVFHFGCFASSFSSLTAPASMGRLIM